MVFFVKRHMTVVCLVGHSLVLSSALDVLSPVRNMDFTLDFSLLFYLNFPFTFPFNAIIY